MAKSKFTGTFLHVVYSPKGGVEGLLVDLDGKTVQFVIDKDDELAPAIVGSLQGGESLTIAGEPLPPSRKGEGSHPVHALDKVVDVEGKAPAKVAVSTGYSGTIARFNYARHGAPNGFVLDNGDFIHVKPEGFAKLGLKVGDGISAEGDAHFLATGGGWAVEATKVNRQILK